MPLKQIVIPKEKATFWMDGRGRWHNRHGPFENRKIIKYFNASIQWDPKGYHVAQQHDGLVEKVYFSYEETALFVVDVVFEDNVLLILNTGAQIALRPDKLFVRHDQLFMQLNRQRIQFNEQTLLKMADKICYEQGCYFFCETNRRHLVPCHCSDAPSNMSSNGLTFAISNTRFR